MTEIGRTVIEPTAEKVRTWLIGRVADYLDEPAEGIDPSVPLTEYGLDSVHAYTLCGEIEDTLSVIVEPTLIWDVESLVDLTDRIVELAAGPSRNDQSPGRSGPVESEL
jgi:acyl carrier protein